MPGGLGRGRPSGLGRNISSGLDHCSTSACARRTWKHFKAPMQFHPQPTAELTDAPFVAREPIAPTGPSPWRRRLLWSGLGLLLLLLLAFLPPLINANRYRRQIARSMSESLGRPVHLDNVTLQLLPVPGLILSNLVVSEDPAFGEEPTIRADSVTGTLRLGSLWRRRVEFSTVRFIEPHVNLVRNAKGRWNLADVLLHASHVDTAPTAQRRAGPAPRFPYIEATGGRVNVKFDQEKLPFAVTDADFALWLPSPGQWRVRLRGQPTRTDTDLSDPGTLRLEGDLQRAATAADVHINLHSSWHDAPLGEASRLLFAEDMGWRGSSNLEAALVGTLRTARWQSKLTLSDLRRTEFAPTRPLDLQVTCGAALSIQTVSLADLLCTMPDEAPQPATLRASALNLQHPGKAAVAVEARDVPAHWGLLWLALFSPRVPTDVHPSGLLQASFAHALPSSDLPALAAPPVRGKRLKCARVPAAQEPVAGWKGWTGQVRLALAGDPENAMSEPGATENSGNSASLNAFADSNNPEPASRKAVAANTLTSSLPSSLVWRLVTTATPIAASSADPGTEAQVPSLESRGPTNAGTELHPALRLQPTPLRLSPGTDVTATGAIFATGYTFSIEGNASTAALLQPARFIPQLGDGMESVLPYPPTSATSARVAFACDRLWATTQTCTSSRASGTTDKAAPDGSLTGKRRSPSRLQRPSSIPR